MTVEVRIPIRTHSQAHGVRCHWSIEARRRKELRHVVALFLGPHRPPRLPAVVTLARVSPKPLDGDNWQHVAKPIRDQVAVWLGLPVNAKGHAEDNSPLVAWVYQQGPDGKGVHAVVVKAEPATQAAVDELRLREAWKPCR